MTIPTELLDLKKEINGLIDGYKRVHQDKLGVHDETLEGLQNQLDVLSRVQQFSRGGKPITGSNPAASNALNAWWRLGDKSHMEDLKNEFSVGSDPDGGLTVSTAAYSTRSLPLIP